MLNINGGMDMVMHHNHRGFYDWLIQRVSAVLIAAYAIFLMAYIACHSPIDYATWRALFNCAWMKICTIVVLLAIIWHAWIGLWTVMTDYVKKRVVRLTLEVLICLLMLFYLLWCLDSLWR